MCHVRPFGVDVYCFIPGEKRGKLDEKARKLKLMGYSEVSKAYRLIDVSTGRITISRDVRFLNSFDSVTQADSVSPSSEVLVPLSKDVATVDPVVTAPRVVPAADQEEEEDVWEDAAPAADDEVLRRLTRSTRGQLPARYACSAEAAVQEEPKTAKEALSGPDSHNRKKAMLDELDSMKSNDAWELVDAPQGRRVLGCKW